MSQGQRMQTLPKLTYLFCADCRKDVPLANMVEGADGLWRCVACDAKQHS